LITEITGTGIAGGPAAAGAAAATGPDRNVEARMVAPTQTTAAPPNQIFQCRMAVFFP
jgi:hypothetical protein